MKNSGKLHDLKYNDSLEAMLFSFHLSVELFSKRLKPYSPDPSVVVLAKNIAAYPRDSLTPPHGSLFLSLLRSSRFTTCTHFGVALAEKGSCPPTNEWSTSQVPSDSVPAPTGHVYGRGGVACQPVPLSHRAQLV